MCAVEKFEKAEKISADVISRWYVVKEIRIFKGNNDSLLSGQFVFIIKECYNTRIGTKT